MFGRTCGFHAGSQQGTNPTGLVVANFCQSLSGNAFKQICEVLEGFSDYARWIREIAGYVFATYKLGGKRPIVGSMIVEDYLRPAAVRAGVIKVDEDGRTFDLDGNKIRRFGFHTFRHSLASFLMAEGENPAVIQATLRHSRLDMTMYYSHARKQQKSAAQGMVLEALLAKRGAERGPKAITQ